MIEFLAGGYRFLVEAAAVITLLFLGFVLLTLFKTGPQAAGAFGIGASLLVIVGALFSLFLVLGLSAVLISLRDSQRRSEKLMQAILLKQAAA